MNLLLLIAIAAVSWRIYSYLEESRQTEEQAEELWMKAAVTAAPAQEPEEKIASGPAPEQPRTEASAEKREAARAEETTPRLASEQLWTEEPAEQAEAARAEETTPRLAPEQPRAEEPAEQAEAARTEGRPEEKTPRSAEPENLPQRPNQGSPIRPIFRLPLISRCFRRSIRRSSPGCIFRIWRLTCRWFARRITAII